MRGAFPLSLLLTHDSAPCHARGLGRWRFSIAISEPELSEFLCGRHPIGSAGASVSLKLGEVLAHPQE